MQSSLPALNNFTVQSERRHNGLHVAIIMDGNGRWAAQRGKYERRCKTRPQCAA